MSSATSSQCSSSLSPERVQSCASSSTSCIGDSNPPTSNQVRTGRNNSILVTSQLSRTDFVDYKQIYRGRYSGIFLCKFKNTGRDVVVKVYPKAIVPSKRIRAVKREAAICRKIKYSSSTSYLSGSVELLGEFEDSTAAYIVQEYCKGRDLLCQIKANGGRVKEEYASTRILQPILRTLTGLHSLGVIHRFGILASRIAQSKAFDKVWFVCQGYKARKHTCVAIRRSQNRRVCTRFGQNYHPTHSSSRNFRLYGARGRDEPFTGRDILFRSAQPYR